MDVFSKKGRMVLMLTHINKRVWVLLSTLGLTLSLMLLPAFAATTVSVLNGQVGVTGTITGNSYTGSGGTTVSNDVVTATAAGGRVARETNTISITNNTDKTATISFSYVASNYNSFSEASASGTKSVDLAAGETRVVMSIEGKNKTTSNTASLVLSGFTYTAAAANPEVTFDYTGGSVTVGGIAVSSGGSVEISSTDGAALVASPNSGYTFLGWVNGNTNAILSTDASYTLYPVGDMTVRAAFASASTNAWFKVDNSMFDDLNAANVAANTAATRVIIPMHDGLLPIGTYTISSGNTLLIPRNAAYSLDTTKPNQTEPTNFSTTPPAVTSFRKLTMADGANITVNGAISIAGTQWAGGMYVSATGASGFIHMNDGSSITINNGGVLYAWGFITGSGSVTAKSGAMVYEQFQVAGWRGGDMTNTMVNSNTYGVFPMSQYYVQNIEVPLTLESGAVETAFASAKITLIGIQPISVAFVGTENAMFKISSGYVIKDYVENEDRLKLEVHGDVSLTPITINMKLGVLGSVNMATSNFELPLNNNMTIHGVSGTMTINQDVALLPGTQVIVDEGVTCTLGNGVNLYAYDADEWGTYCGSTNKTFMAVAHAPGRTYTRTVDDLVDASICINGTVDASQGYLYTTKGKANVHSTGTGVVKTQPGTQIVTYQVVQAKEPADSTYSEIPITPAQLKNGDGSYVDTSVAGETLTYTYENGFWKSNAVATIVSQKKDYRYLASAINAYGSDDSYIQMLTDTTESTIGDGNKDIYLDLNGQDVTVTELKVKNLYGMDTATNGFTSDTADKYGEIIGTVSGTVAQNYQYDRTTGVSGKYYVTSATKNLSFHRFDMGVTDYTFYGSGTTGEMVFNMVFKGDALAKAEILKRGVCFDESYNWNGVEDTMTGRITNITGDNFTTAYTVKAAVMLRDADNTNESDYPVFTGDKYFANGISFQSAMKAVYAELTDEAKKDAFEKFATANSFSLSN